MQRNPGIALLLTAFSFSNDCRELWMVPRPGSPIRPIQILLNCNTLASTWKLIKQLLSGFQSNKVFNAIISCYWLSSTKFGLYYKEKIRFVEFLHTFPQNSPVSKLCSDELSCWMYKRDIRYVWSSDGKWHVLSPDWAWPSCTQGLFTVV